MRTAHGFVWLMAHYAVPRLPIVYLPLGALLLWSLGWLAVLGPAPRAARVTPTVAMRSAWTLHAPAVAFMRCAPARRRGTVPPRSSRPARTATTLRRRSLG